MKLVIASGNKNKLDEFRRLLKPFGMEAYPQGNFNVPEADETGLSFVENAIIKARNACRYSGLPSLADDSGIEVDSLNGEPGIYSARFAGEHGDDSANNQKLVQMLASVPASERTARYQAILVFMRHETDPTPVVCQGSWEGLIIDDARGSNGFGYDPHFFVPALEQTAAELDANTKNAISHRGKALAELLPLLKRLSLTTAS